MREKRLENFMGIWKPLIGKWWDGRKSRNGMVSFHFSFSLWYAPYLTSPTFTFHVVVKIHTSKIIIIIKKKKKFTIFFFCFFVFLGPQPTPHVGFLSHKLSSPFNILDASVFGFYLGWCVGIGIGIRIRIWNCIVALPSKSVFWNWGWPSQIYHSKLINFSFHYSCSKNEK